MMLRVEKTLLWVCEDSCSSQTRSSLFFLDFQRGPWGPDMVLPGNPACAGSVRLHSVVCYYSNTDVVDHSMNAIECRKL